MADTAERRFGVERSFWAHNVSGERSLLEILAILTGKHGPWEAARIAFHPINQRSGS